MELSGGETMCMVWSATSNLSRCGPKPPHESTHSWQRLPAIVGEPLSNQGIPLSARLNDIRERKPLDLQGLDVNACAEKATTIRDAHNLVEDSEIFDFGRVCRTYQPGLSWQVFTLLQSSRIGCLPAVLTCRAQLLCSALVQWRIQRHEA